MQPSLRPARPEIDRSAAAERELQDFSYIVSHDLAASFRHVAVFSRLLIGELGHDLTPRQEMHANRIREATSKCQMMLEQLLVHSRVAQNALELAAQDGALAVNLALLQLSSQIQAAGAEVKVEPLGHVDADPALLTLALHHLLDNAIKFRRPNTHPRITVKLAEDELFWRVVVEDNGLGVEPAYREKAFQMFHRLNAEDAFLGVGAGLAICRRIARRHGGDVMFRDSAEGARVELALPRVAADR